MSKASQLLSESKDKDDKALYQQRVLMNRKELEAQQRAKQGAHPLSRHSLQNVPAQVPGTLTQPRLPGYQATRGGYEKPVERSVPTGPRPPQQTHQDPSAPSTVPFGQGRRFTPNADDVGSRRQDRPAPFSSYPRVLMPWEREKPLPQENFAPRTGIQSWREMETPHGEQDPFSHRNTPRTDMDPALIRHMKSKEELGRSHKPTYKPGYVSHFNKEEFTHDPGRSGTGMTHKKNESRAQQVTNRLGTLMGEMGE